MKNYVSQLYPCLVGYSAMIIRTYISFNKCLKFLDRFKKVAQLFEFIRGENMSHTGQVRLLRSFRFLPTLGPVEARSWEFLCEIERSVTSLVQFQDDVMLELELEGIYTFVIE